jgi:hypothetical protein
MRPFIYTISFLLSFFLTLSVYLLVNMRPGVEKFAVGDQTQQVQTQPPQVQTPSLPVSAVTDTVLDGTSLTGANIQKIIPAYDDNFLSFNVYNIDNKLKNDLGKWYDSDSDSYFLQFTPNTIGTTKLVDDIQGYVKSVNAKNIEFKGPNASQFANDTSTFEISKFTFLTMVKFNGTPVVGAKNTVFELLCNTTSDDDSATTHPVYSSQVISLNLQTRSVTAGATISTFVDAIVRIGKDTNTQTIPFQHSAFYTTTGSPILISLSYDKTTKLVTLTVGNVKRTFTITTPNTITLGSAPFILNKGGEMDINMYSAAFYNKAMTDVEILTFQRFNDYYINGNNKLLEQSQTAASQLSDASKKLQKLQGDLKKCEASTSSPSAAGSSQSASSSQRQPGALLSMRVPELMNLSAFNVRLPSQR